MDSLFSSRRRLELAEGCSSSRSVVDDDAKRPIPTASRVVYSLATCRRRTSRKVGPDDDDDDNGNDDGFDDRIDRTTGVATLYLATEKLSAP